MSQYYAQVSNGIVINVIEGEPGERFAKTIKWLPCGKNTKIGDIYNAATKTTETPTLNFEDERRITLGIVNTVYREKMSLITRDYDSFEIASWPIQYEEALAVLNGKPTEALFLAGLVAERKMNLEELAMRVIKNSKMFRYISGKLTGRRQYFEDRIMATTNMTGLLKIRKLIDQWREEGVGA